MATVVVNKPDHIEFKNVIAADAVADAPTVVFQSGEWASNGRAETGIAVDVFGAQLPLLLPADARKLAKWLNRAADELDGSNAKKKRKQHPQRDEEENDRFY